MIKQFSGIFFLIAITSCVQADELSESEKQLIINDVTEMFINYHDEIRKDGLTAEFK